MRIIRKVAARTGLKPEASHEKTKSWLPYFIAVIIAWGSTFVFIKGCLDFLTPVGVAFTRYALGALFKVV